MIKHSNGKDRIRNRTFNIRNYPYRISIQIFKVRFIRSKYDEYQYSTYHILSVSKFDQRIESERENYLYLYPQYLIRFY
jgi:hypothetical protein